MTTWGAWTSDGRLRAGLAMSYSPNPVVHSTASVTVSWTLYGESYYASNESGSTATPYVVSGGTSASGYGQGWNVGALGTWVVASGSYSVNTSYTSSVNTTLNAHWTSTYAYPGDQPSVSLTLTIPKRPIAAPASPTGCAYTRVSDTSHTVTWTNTSPTDTAAPYTNLHVQRSTDGGSWTAIATLGVVSSYSDTGTSANHKYQYRVYASNSAGNSGYSTSSVFYTTGSPPTNVVATKTSGGDITVTWTDASTWNDTFAIWHAANGVWDGAALSTTIPNGTNTYTHTAPSTSVTHSYKLTVHTTPPSLTSGYSATSNTVSLVAAPNAPTSLAPSGTVTDGSSSIALSWVHNPTDTTPQRKFEVQYQTDGGAFGYLYSATRSVTDGTTATNTTVTSATAAFTSADVGAFVVGGSVPAGAYIVSVTNSTTVVISAAATATASALTLTFNQPYFTSATSATTVAAAGWGANGHIIGWQVRTWGSATTGGSDGTGASPWSATATVTLSSKPTAVINAPGGIRTVTDGATTISSTTVTSATANFVTADVGAAISGTGIPTGSTISSVTNSTTVVISAAATATATGLTLSIDEQVYSSTLTVTWGYAQAEGSPEAQWRLSLLDSTGTITLETISTAGADTSVTMATKLSNLTTYQLVLSVQSTAGLWSTPDTQVFDVAYALPPTPTISGLWQPSTGSVGLTVDCPAPVTPQVAADHLQVWRSLDAGVTWALVADNVPLGTTVNDNIPALAATNTYLVVAVSATPSQQASGTVAVDTTVGCHHVWVNAGPSFATGVCFTTSVDLGWDDGIEKALNRYAGRSKAVETMGEQTEQIITLRAVKYDPLVASALAAETSPLADIAALAKLAAPACIRTPDGMRVFVSTSVPSFGGLGTAKVRSIQWTFAEVDYTEPAGIPG